MPPETMTIGRLAKAAGVNVETVRFYQPQQLGFTLEEIGHLLEHSDGRRCRDVRVVAEKRFALVVSRIAQLDRMRAQRERLIEACKARTKGACPLIEALGRE